MISSFTVKYPERTAIIAILVAVLVISFSDAVVKLVSAGFSLWQLFTLRSLVCLLGLLIVARYTSYLGLLCVKNLRWVLLRNALITFQYALYYAALPNVALSVAAASIYTMPLIVSVLAIVFLSDKGGWKVWAGVLLGYVGVLFIVQPQHDEFNYYGLLPLAAALFAALSNLVTKSKCVDEHAIAIGFNLNLMLLGIGVVASLLSLIWSPNQNSSASIDFLLRDWKTMGRVEWAAILLMAIAFGIGSIATAYAYQIGPVATIATLDFAYIAFAVLWGVVFFAQLPTATIALGIVLIIIAGMLVIRAQIKPISL